MLSSLPLGHTVLAPNQSLVEFKRASLGTYFDLSGVLRTAAVDTPRYETNGLLIEGPATNLLLWSEQLDNAAWAKVLAATVTANSDTAPDGTTTADTINFNATDGNRIEQTSSVVALNGITYAFGVWLKGSGTINLNVGTSSGVGGQTEPNITLTSVWTRYTAAFTANSPTGNVRALIIWRSGNTATAVKAWGAQLELGSAPSSYIATTSAPVTRAADLGYLYTPDAVVPITAAEARRAGMKYRALSATGDYVFGSGSVWLVDSPQAVAQAVKTRLQLMVGDWFLDQKEGLNRSLILGVGTAQTRDREIQQRILGTPGVKSLISYASNVDNRKFTVTATIDTIYGAAVFSEIL
jgi:hypothetical protein